MFSNISRITLDKVSFTVPFHISISKVSQTLIVVLAQILEDQLQVFVSSLAAHLSVTEVKKTDCNF
jgi:hypothetical protein